MEKSQVSRRPSFYAFISVKLRYCDITFGVLTSSKFQIKNSLAKRILMPTGISPGQLITRLVAAQRRVLERNWSACTH